MVPPLPHHASFQPQAHNITAVPATWEELLTVLQLHNGTADWDGDGQKDPALCVQAVTPGTGTIFTLFNAILASFTQFKGKEQGFMLEPLTLEPLVSFECLRLLLGLQPALPCHPMDPSVGRQCCMPIVALCAACP